MSGEERTLVRSMHPAAFRSRDWAEIVMPDEAAGRPCWLVRWPDGVTDVWVQDDPDPSLFPNPQRRRSEDGHQEQPRGVRLLRQRRGRRTDPCPLPEGGTKSPGGSTRKVPDGPRKPERSGIADAQPEQAETSESSDERGATTGPLPEGEQ